MEWLRMIANEGAQSGPRPLRFAPCLMLEYHAPHRSFVRLYASKMLRDGLYRSELTRDAPVALPNLLMDKDLLRLRRIVEGVRNISVQRLLVALERQARSRRYAPPTPPSRVARALRQPSPPGPSHPAVPAASAAPESRSTSPPRPTAPASASPAPRTSAPDAAASAVSHPRTSAATPSRPPPPHRPAHPPSCAMRSNAVPNPNGASALNRPALAEAGIREHIVARNPVARAS